MFALVDCNNFYVSCERVFEPALRDRPVAVLSNNDGCVVARSEEIKQMGVDMGQPFFQCRELLNKHNTAVLSSNYTLYGDMSRRVMNTLSHENVPLIRYSIDESFLHFNNLPEKDHVPFARHLQKKVKRHVGIPVSIGIGATKTLAKITNHIAKDDPTTGGVFTFSGDEERKYHLQDTPVEDVWGIGPRYGEMLRRHDIHTARELTQVPDRWIQNQMTIVGVRTARELRGMSCISLDEMDAERDRIRSSRTFSEKVTSFSNLKQAVARYTSRAARKLREQDGQTSQVSLFITTGQFVDDQEDYYANAASVELPVATDYTPELIHAAEQLLSDLYREGYRYRKAGVTLEDLTPRKPQQQDLFRSDAEREKHHELMNTLDQLNESFGKGTVQFASEGLEPDWKMKRKRLSPAYTTNWADLPVVDAR